MEARALARVQSILADSDALSEVVKNDYGEDLIVQTHHEGRADPFQILIQVKGSGVLEFRDGQFSYRFRTGHMLRWISQTGSILICVFDDVSKRVFAFSPKERFSLWEVLTSKTKTLKVSLSTKNELTIDTAKTMIWKCRVEHFSTLLAISENRQHYIELHDAPDDIARGLQRETGLICLLFMKEIGMIIGDSFKNTVRRQIVNGATYFNTKWPDDEWSLRHLMMFALIGEINEATGCGVPSNIMEQVTEAAGNFYKSFHPEEWSNAERHMRLIWTPYGGHEKR